jgi:hypothetical protein
MRAGITVRAALCLAAAMALAACGGGSDETKTVTKHLGLGDTATLHGPNKKANVDVKVEASEGDPADLKDFRLSASEKNMTPWYVTTTAVNNGKDLVQADAQYPPIVVKAIDDHGLNAKEIGLIGDFPKCVLVNQPDPFKQGDSFTDCAVYLVRKGSTLKSVDLQETVFEGKNKLFTWKVA